MRKDVLNFKVITNGVHIMIVVCILCNILYM